MSKTYSAALMASLFLFFPQNSSGQSTQGQATEAPTSFQTEVDRTDSVDELSKQLPSTQLINRGGRGKAQTLYIRGSRTTDIAFTLEGIQLHSGAFGDYDLSSFDLFGLESARLIRGGYAPFNSSPAGQVQFFLPQTEKVLVEAGFGSYLHSRLALLLPGLSFSFDIARNDFGYESDSGFNERSHNQSRNAVIRKWKRFSNSQLWAQVLVSDQNLPGPTFFPSEGYQQSIDSLVAYQGAVRNWSWDIWANFKQLESGSDTFTSSTQSSYSGGLLRYKHNLVDSIVLQHSGGLQYDYFNSSLIDHKHRSSLHYSLSAFFSPIERLLIHPRARVEYVSDLEQGFSPHGGIGLRFRAKDDLSILSNVSYISRVPDFFSLYFEGFGVDSNPDLKRQKLFQTDLGYEWDPSDLNLFVQQAFFLNRGSDLIRSTQSLNGNFQAQNFEKGTTWGIESELKIEFHRRLRSTQSYTFTRSRINDSPEAYQPAHQIFVRPEFDLNRFLTFASPFYFRSKTKVASSANAESLDKQFDLGLSLYGKRKSWSYGVTAHNVLAWKRIEVRGYPLPQEAYFEAKLSKEF